MSRIRAFAGYGPDSEAAPTDDEIQDHSLLLMDDIVAKHLGPGPHPSGSPQSVHSGRGTKVGPPSADIDEAPEVFYDSQATSIMIGGARTDAHDAIVKRSVDAFEEAYPNFLPETVEFYFTTQKNGGAGAWVERATPDIVYVNIDYWEDLPSIARNWKGPELAIRKYSKDIDVIREGVLFHELAHVGAFSNWGFYHPGDLPYYTKTWYPENVKSDHPSLPSMYATSSQTEYLAEALTDAAYNGEDAAPLSQRSARWLRKVWLPNRDRLATLTEEAVGSAAVTKHAGPGAHPSGSPQSVHGGRGVWLSDAPDFEQIIPGLKDRKVIKDDLLWGTKEEGILFQGERIEYDQERIIKAVTEFRETFPGVLPKVPRVVFLTPEEVIRDHPDVPDGAEAWVNPYDMPSTVFIRKEAWDTDTDLSQYKAVEGVAFRKAKQFGGRKAQDTYKEAIVFHELAHVGMAIHGWEGAPGLPHYGPEWYDEQVPGKDPSLPSMYAATHHAEFFAEALSDYHLRKQKAAPLSIVTVEKVKDLLENGRDDEWHGDPGEG